MLLLQRAPARLPVPSARAPPAEPLPRASPAPLTRTFRATRLRSGRRPLGTARLRAAHPCRTLQRLPRALARATPARPRRLARLSAPRSRAALPAAAWIPSASPPPRRAAHQRLGALRPSARRRLPGAGVPLGAAASAGQRNVREGETGMETREEMLPVKDRKRRETPG
jgi:hypothetical protein